MNLLTAMKVFERVSRLGSLSAAARELNMSTTAVSRMLKQLEDDLGVRLLNRTTRRINPTEAGRNYAERVKGLLEDVEALQDQTRRLDRGTRGLLRISCSNILAHARVTRLIPRFLDENPMITVEFDLTSRYVLPNFARRLGSWPFGTGDARFSVPVRGRVSTNSIEAACQLTLAGAGIGYLPGLVVLEALADGRLEALFEDHGPVSSPIYALYPHRTHVPMKVRAFIDFLASELTPGLD